MPSPMTGENMVHLSQKEGGLEPRSLGEWICREAVPGGWDSVLGALDGEWEQ